MSRRNGLWLALFSYALAGCAAPPLQCPDPDRDCPGVLGFCEPTPADCRRLEPGASYALVDIDSSPTPAAIYVNGEYAGRTPLRHLFSYTSATRYVIVVAEPLYPSQTPQERRLRLPPLPARLQFYMNNPPAGEEAGAAPR